MKKVFTFLFLILLLLPLLSIGQIVTECNGVINPSDRLWVDFAQNPARPGVLPSAVPANINYPGLTKKTINASYSELKAAIEELVANKGGVISFKNTGSGKTIFFNEAIEISNSPSKPCVTILIQGGDKVTFNGKDKSSIFVIRKSVKVIVQNAVFKNCTLTRQIVQNRRNFRVGGGAIEVTSGAALRVYGCRFLENRVAEWDDTPGGGYDGVGENQNGAGIRFNFHSTGEVFKSTFENCRAVTGGAIGATSINKLTIMDCNFTDNTSTAYNTKSSNRRRVVEGAGALRVDRTAKPLEIYRTTFKGNAANLKASVMEVFIRPLRDRARKETGPYPGLSTFALVIDGCTFEDNTYYNFRGANDPERGDFFSGCMLFHGGKLDANFRGAKMKITNTKFIGNEAGESNVRSFLGFEIRNTLFANTKFLRLKGKNGKFKTGKGALALRSEIPGRGLIDNCTFYNNEPNPQDPVIRGIASDIFFWNGQDAKYTLNNSVFYRKNKNSRIRQVSEPMKGSGNNQFVPGVDLSAFADVSRSRVTRTNPNIQGNVKNLCLGTNSLPKGIGGLSDCGGGPTLPDGNGGTQALFADGTYFLEAFNSGQRMFSSAGKSHEAHMQNTKSTGNGNQKWVLKHLGGNIYTIKNMKTERFLEVPFAKCENSLQAATYTRVLGDHQRWKIEANGTGVYALLPAHCTAQALDRNRGAANTNVHTYAFNKNNANQKWKIIASSSSSAFKISVPSEQSEEGILIYPNPVKDRLTVTGLKENDVLTIHDFSGKIVKSIKVKNKEEQISLNSLKPGMYWVGVSGANHLKLQVVK